MTAILAPLLFLAQGVLLVEPLQSPWARPSGASHYRQHRVAGWRVLTWTDRGGDRIVRLQRWRRGFTLIYERWYRPGDAPFDRAEIIVGNCARGDPVWEEGGREPGSAEVRAALLRHLGWCEVAPDSAARMIEGFERAYPAAAARGRAAAADADAAGLR